MITGASSGIGEALAIEYSTEGVNLFISGRNEQRLEAVQKKCIALGAKVNARVIDVVDEHTMHDWIIDCDRIKPLDLVIANAGIGIGFSPSQNIADHTKAIFDVNVNGVFNTVHPAIHVMQPRKIGQIAIVSSLAGYHGMPSAPAYSTSKVTVKAYGEALRGIYDEQGIAINVICPGFVRSRITDKNDFPMPFFMESDKAAKIIRKGLEKNKGHIAFPWQTKFIFAAMVRLLPEFILERILSRMPKK